MKYTEALAKVGACEADLRKLLSEAAAEGDYASVLRIADLAKALAGLTSGGRAPAAPVAGSAAAPAAEEKRASATPAPGSRKARVTEAYPKFFRRGDELVKVGWSKKDRKEYNHRAGRQAIDAVATALRQLAAKGRMFTGDKLLPLKDPTDGSRIADYQAYVALAWCKHLGLVEQHGRKSGYTVAPDRQIESTVSAAWPELAEWRG